MNATVTPMTCTKSINPLWVEAYRCAAAIPPPFSPDHRKRQAAIHAYWQAVLRAIREEQP